MWAQRLKCSDLTFCPPTLLAQERLRGKRVAAKLRRAAGLGERGSFPCADASSCAQNAGTRRHHT
eukprot:scaffold93291_cov29-Tisochrysis_lutea.AAC.4